MISGTVEYLDPVSLDIVTNPVIFDLHRSIADVDHVGFSPTYALLIVFIDSGRFTIVDTKFL